MLKVLPGSPNGLKGLESRLTDEQVETETDEFLDLATSSTGSGVAGFGVGSRTGSSSSSS